MEKKDDKRGEGDARLRISYVTLILVLLMWGAVGLLSFQEDGVQLRDWNNRDQKPVMALGAIAFVIAGGLILKQSWAYPAGYALVMAHIIIQPHRREGALEALDTVFNIAVLIALVAYGRKITKQKINWIIAGAVITGLLYTVLYYASIPAIESKELHAWLEKTHSITNEALAQKNMSICDQLENPGDIGSCYGSYALEYREPETCPLIEDEWEKDTCYKNLGNYMNNCTICENIKNEKRRGFCLELCDDGR